MSRRMSAPAGTPRGRSRVSATASPSRSSRRRTLDGSGRVLRRNPARARLAHPDPNALDREALDNGVGNRGRERLEQLERVPVGDLLHAVGDVAVVDRFLDAIRSRRLCDVDADVVEEHLAVTALVLEHPVLSEHLEAVKLDGDHPTAAATVSASTCSRTSWTRKIVAPRS